MTRRVLPVLAAILTAFALASCAVEGGNETQPIRSAPVAGPARVGLPPVYRAFYDELVDEGDWTLIEPYGWVFRPYVTYGAWRPYSNGWWEPSDLYGWVWNSNDRFGWITDHYGSWFFDRFQGWVWAPGPLWAPSWVAWSQVGDYIGWAPLPPNSWSDFDRVPGGTFTYVDAHTFTSSAPSSSALFVDRLPEASVAPRAIMNLGRANGATFNKGPDPVLLRQLGASVPVASDLNEFRKVRVSAAPGGVAQESDLVARTQRMWQAGEKELVRYRTEHVAPPAPPIGGSGPVLKPPARPLAPPVRDPEADSTRTKSAHGTGGRNHGPKPPHAPKPKHEPGAAADSLRG